MPKFHYDPDLPADPEDIIGSDGNAFYFTRSVGVRGYAVRARIRRHEDKSRCYAVGEILAADRSWKPVTSTSPDSCFSLTPSPHTSAASLRRALEPMAESLIASASCHLS